MSNINIREKTEISVGLYYADWCPHCRSFYPKDESGRPLELSEIKDNKEESWQEIKQKLTKVDGYKVTCYNKSEKECTEAEKQTIDGWPTIMVKINEGVYKYNGGRNYKELEESIKRGIIQQKNGDELVGGNIKYHNVDYKEKYKKYKKLYFDLMNKK
jgi:thiol-disulfide isomerase/thioredoxin